MLVLIDESGDPGFRLEKGSTPIFAVSMVIFNEFKEAERCSARIAALQKQLGVNREFKFNKSHNNVRDAFFKGVCGYDFTVRALVVDKAKIQSAYLKGNKEQFYSFFLKLLLKHDGGALANASVKIDGSGNRIFKKELRAYLARELVTGKVSKVKLVDSKGDNLIQLADMTVGAIARSYRTDRADADRWRGMLKPRIDNVWDFQ